MNSQPIHDPISLFILILWYSHYSGSWPKEQNLGSFDCHNTRTHVSKNIETQVQLFSAIFGLHGVISFIMARRPRGNNKYAS